MSDYQNMGPGERKFYERLDSLGFTSDKRSARLVRRETLGAEGAEKDYILTLETQDGNTHKTSIEWDAYAFGRAIDFAKGLV